MWSFTKLYIAIVAFSILFHVCGYLVNYDQFTEPSCRGVKHTRPLKGTSLQSKWSSFSFRRRRNESADVRHLREQAFWTRRGNGRYSQFWWCPALNVALMGIVMAPCGNPLIFSNKHNGIRFSFSCGSKDTSNGAKQWFAENRHAIASTQNSQPPHARRWRAAASHLAEEHRAVVDHHLI